MDPETGNAITENGEFVKDPNRGIPQDLWQEIVKWADSQGYSRNDGNYKKANKPFHDAIMSLPEKVKESIVEETAEWAERFIDCFNCEGTAELVLEIMSERQDHNCAPCRKVLSHRSDYTQEKAPNRRKLEGKDYSD
jgi:hypothetical protein